MRIIGLCIAVAAATLPAGAWADGINYFSQPASVSQIMFADEGNVTLASCDSACDALPEDACGACAPLPCGGCCEGPIGAWLARDPFRLPQPCVLQNLGIDAGGWLQAGITANGEDPADNFNGPVLTNDRHGDVQMNQLWLYLHRPVDTSDGGFDVGGRIDLLYGTDWRVAYFHGFGAEDVINGPNQLYGLSVPQFYAEFALNDLSVKIGRMTGILGYETLPSMGNFFYSHSYALFYGEPILITGLMANYTIADRLSLLGGVHQGIHRFEDNNDSKNFQGGLMWSSPNQRLSLAYALDVGRNAFDPTLEDEYVHSLVMKYQISPKLLYVLQNDLGWANGAGQNADAEWYGINQYLMYTLTEKWSAGVRVEWFRDDDGTRVMGLGNLNAQGWSAPSGLPGYSGDFTELTLGLNWKPKANIFIRPEVRWDWYDGTTNAAAQLPFDAGNSSSQFTLATDLIVTF